MASPIQGSPGLTNLGFIPSQTRFEEGVSSLSGLLDVLHKQKEDRKTASQKRADERLRLILDISATWAPGDWERHQQSVEGVMTSAGYDPQLAKMFVESQKKRALSASEPDRLMGEFAGMMRGSLMPSAPQSGDMPPGGPPDESGQPTQAGTSPLEAYYQAIQGMLQRDPGALAKIAPDLKSLPDVLARPGEAKAMEREMAPEESPLAKDYRFWSTLLGPAAARQKMLAPESASLTKIDVAWLAAGGDERATKALDILDRDEGSDRSPTAVDLAIWAAGGSESAQRALDIYRGPQKQVDGLTAEQRKDILAFRKTIPSLERITSLSELVNTGGSGPLTRVMGGVKRGMGRMNLDDATALYESTVRGFVPLFARALGHTGVLTEIDVARTEELFPKVGDSATLARAKLENVRTLMDAVQEKSRTLLGGGGGESLAVEAPPGDESWRQYEGVPLSQWPEEALTAYEDYLGSTGGE